MGQPPRVLPPGEARSDGSDAAPPSIDSHELLAGRRELIIRHGSELYRLRVTASNKLILTK